MKVKTVSQVVCPPPVPLVMRNEPAESVELAATAAVGDVAQFVGVPIVGALVWVDLKWALSICSMANVEVLPAILMTDPDVSALKIATFDVF